MIKKKLIIIFGPEAVGKMTVGQHLAPMLDYNLIVYDYFTDLCLKTLKTHKFKTFENLVSYLFKGIGQSASMGFIFTFPWNFSKSKDRLFVNQLIHDSGVRTEDVYFVELDASQRTRLFRNVTDNRLNNKPYKRNADVSAKELKEMDKTGNYHSSYEEFSSKKHYLYINNEDLTPTEVSRMIIEKFSLGGDYENN